MHCKLARAGVAGEAGRIGTSRERVVARPLVRQLSEEFKRACAPFQDALGTEAGADALVRAARASMERGL